MARFLALSLRIFSLAAAASFISGFPVLLASPTNAPPANPAPPSSAASNKPATPPPVPAQDPFNRYGNILQPGTEPAHSLRLIVPFPDVGEIKIPSQAELISRQKLEALATLSDSQIRDQLNKWSPLSQMSLRDEAALLARIQDFRDHRTKTALQAAHDMGLPTLTPEQQVRFEKEYWNKRLAMERDLAKQFEPILKQRRMELSEDLYREFSSPKPPAQTKPAPPVQTAQAGPTPSQPPAH